MTEIRDKAQNFMARIGKAPGVAPDSSSGVRSNTVTPNSTPSAKGAQKYLDFIKGANVGGDATPVNPVNLDNPEGTMVGRGLRSAGNTGGQLLGSLQEFAGESLGFEEWAKAGREKADRNAAEQAVLGQSMQKFWDIDGLGDLGTWSVEQGSNLVTMMIPTILSGIASGTLATAAGLGAGAIKTAQIIGQVAANYPTMFATHRESQREELKATGKPLEVSEGLAAIMAIPATVLDLIGLKMITKGVVPKAIGSNIFTKIVVNPVTGAMSEGVTEIGQEIIDRYQSNRPLDSEEAMWSYVEIGATAGLVGGAMKTGAGLLDINNEPKVTPSGTNTPPPVSPVSGGLPTPGAMPGSPGVVVVPSPPTGPPPNVSLNSQSVINASMFAAPVVGTPQHANFLGMTPPAPIVQATQATQATPVVGGPVSVNPQAQNVGTQPQTTTQTIVGTGFTEVVTTNKLTGITTTKKYVNGIVTEIDGVEVPQKAIALSQAPADIIDADFVDITDVIAQGEPDPLAGIGNWVPDPNDPLNTSFSSGATEAELLALLEAQNNNQPNVISITPSIPPSPLSAIPPISPTQGLANTPQTGPISAPVTPTQGPGVNGANPIALVSHLSQTSFGSVLNIDPPQGVQALPLTQPFPSNGPLELDPNIFKYESPKIGGSSKGGIYTHIASGVRYMAKQYKDSNQALNEHLAQNLFNGLTPTHEVKKLVSNIVSTPSGSKIFLIEMVSDLIPFDKNNVEHIDIAKKQFAVNAWLANHDVFGLHFDNVGFWLDPKTFDLRIVYFDLGGALLYRGMNGLKGLTFKHTVNEIEKLKDPSVNPNAAWVYKGLSVGELVSQMSVLNDRLGSYMLQNFIDPLFEISYNLNLTYEEYNLIFDLAGKLWQRALDIQTKAKAMEPANSFLYYTSDLATVYHMLSHVPPHIQNQPVVLTSTTPAVKPSLKNKKPAPPIAPIVLPGATATTVVPKSKTANAKKTPAASLAAAQAQSNSPSLPNAFSPIADIATVEALFTTPNSPNNTMGPYVTPTGNTVVVSPEVVMPANFLNLGSILSPDAVSLPTKDQMMKGLKVKFTYHPNQDPNTIHKEEDVVKAGMIVVHDGKIVMVSPANNFGGEYFGLPKGGVDKGDGTVYTALKEFWEETGMLAEFTGEYLDFNYKSSSGKMLKSRVFLGNISGGNPKYAGSETAMVLFTKAYSHHIGNEFTKEALSLFHKVIHVKTQEPLLKNLLAEYSKNVMQYMASIGVGVSSAHAKLKGFYTSAAYKLMQQNTHFELNYQGNKVWFDPNTNTYTLTNTGIPLVLWHKTNTKDNLYTSGEQKASTDPMLNKGTSEFNMPKFIQLDKKKKGHGIGGSDTTYGWFMSGPESTWGTPSQGFPIICKMENPYIVKAGKSYSGSSFSAILIQAYKDGHDFVIFPEAHDAVSGTQYVALYNKAESNVKLLDNKVGTWRFGDHKSNLTNQAMGLLDESDGFPGKELISFPGEEPLLAPMQHHLIKFKYILRRLGLENDVKLYWFTADQAKQAGRAGWFRDVAMGLSIGISTANGDVMNTFNHEVFHLLEAVGLFSSSPKMIKANKLLNQMADTVWIKKYQLDTNPLYNMKDEQGNLNVDLLRKEAKAQAYADHHTDNEIQSGLVKYAFDKIHNFFTALMSWAKGYGFQSSSDIFEFISGGKLDMEKIATDWQYRKAMGNYTSAQDNMSQWLKQTPMNPNIKKTQAFYSKLTKYGYGLLQLAQVNPKNLALQHYNQIVRMWHDMAATWRNHANKTATKWSSLGIKEQTNLTNFIKDYDQMNYRTIQEVQQGIKRQPTRDELVVLANSHNLTTDSVMVFEQMRLDYSNFLNKIEEVTVNDRMRTGVVDPVTQMIDVATQLDILQIQKEFNDMRTYPFIPHSRFGEYTITVKDAVGNTVYHEQFETEAERNAASGEVWNAFPENLGFKPFNSKLSKEQQPYAGMPHALLLAIKNNLTLNHKQQLELNDLIAKSLPALSFKNHFIRKKNIAGESSDALRAYSNYFFHGSNHIARLQYGPDLKAAIKEARDAKTALDNLGFVDTTKDAEIITYMNTHLESIMNPQPDWATLRTIGFAWYLWFNLKSAAMNLTQVPLVTASHLGAVFGTLKTTTSLTKASAELRHAFTNPDKIIAKLSVSDAKLRNQAYEEFVLDEGISSELAGLASGSALNKGLSKTRMRKAVLTFSHWGGYFFSVSEKLNRSITFVASVDLAKKAWATGKLPKYMDEVIARNDLNINKKMNEGWTFEEAVSYYTAVDTINQTQFNYEAYARPELMRNGVTSGILLFFMFKQGMLFFLRHNPGRTRYLITLLFAAGIMGMPGAEDGKEIAKMLGKLVFGEHWDIEKEVRLWANEVFGSPETGSIPPADLMLHGASRYGFGLGLLGDLTGIPLPDVDVSGSLSMGNLLPVVSPLIKGASDAVMGKDFNDVLSDVGTQSVGGTLSIPINFLKAMANERLEWSDPKKHEGYTPVFIGNALKAYRWASEERERGASGNTTLEFDREDIGHNIEIAAQALGFKPSRLSEQQDRDGMRYEVAQFWEGRRDILRNSYWFAINNKNKDALNSVMENLKIYNSEVPNASLKMTLKQLQTSAKLRRTAADKKEEGTTTKAMTPVLKDVDKLFLPRP